MPEKHFYFAVGGVVGSAVCAVIAKKRRQWKETSRFFQWLYNKEPHWFLYCPIVIFLVGMWGLIPDIIHFLGLLPKEVTRGALFDVFFFHSTFEHIENTMPLVDRYLNFLGQVMLLLVCLGVMLFYVRQAKRALKS